MLWDVQLRLQRYLIVLVVRVRYDNISGARGRTLPIVLMGMGPVFLASLTGFGRVGRALESREWARIGEKCTKMVCFDREHANGRRYKKTDGSESRPNSGEKDKTIRALVAFV